MEPCRDPAHPPVRVQGEVGGAGLAPREKDIIEVGREQIPGQWLLQYLPPNPRLCQLPEDIERRKRQVNNPSFLTQLERNVKRKREELKTGLRSPK